MNVRNPSKIKHCHAQYDTNTVTKTSNVTCVTKVRSTSACLFASMWSPLVSVITTLYYVAMIFIAECGIACFFCVMRVFKVRASSSSARLPLCQMLFLLWPPLLSYPT